MTTTIVYGDVSDGSVFSSDASYATARTGPADSTDNVATASYGQSVTVGGTYTISEAFLRFSFPAVAAGQVVTSAALQFYQATQVSTGVVRDLEVRGFTWSASGLAVGDWRTPTQLAALPLYATVAGVQASLSKYTTAGSDALRALIPGQTSLEVVLSSSRQRVGNTPTGNEGSAVASADASGTTQDPKLIFTTLTDTALIPVMGGAAQLSDGSVVFLAASGSTVDLIRDALGVTTTLASLALGTTTSSWADVPAAQGMTLAVDDQDNIYVTGRAGNADNSLRHVAYVKTAGVWTWTAGTIRTLPLPAHDAPINNVSASWTPAGGGTLVIIASHAPGQGESGGNDGDVAYALVNSQYLLDGVTGSQNRGTGSALAAGILPADLTSGHFNGYVNDTGSGLDVVQDRVQTDWTYVASFRRSQPLGGNLAVAVGRVNLNSTAGGFDFVDSGTSSCYGTKDASAKLRALSVGSGQVAVVSADAEAGFGLSVQVLQHNGNVSGWVSLGSVPLAGEAIPSMPDGPAVKASLAWDAFYSTAENAVWIYYVDVANPNRLMRTSVDLDTYQATRTEVAVYTAASAILAVRTARNAQVAQKTQVVVATSAGYTRIQDTLNQPPLAPELAVRFNFDATAAATFSWTFQDPNAGDAQSAYQLQIIKVSDGTTALDTGKVVSATQSRVVAAGTLTNGQTYQWRVMTWDATDTAGPWSTYGSFTTSAGGTVTITDPATDNPAGVITDDYLVAWSVAGTVQASFRVWATRNDTGATVHDSFLAAGTQTTWLVAGMVSDVEHTIHVVVFNSSGVGTNTATRLITPSYGTPEVPLVTVTPSTEGGYVLVSVDNPPPQGDRPDVVRNRILQRLAGSTGAWEVLGECGPDGSFRDYTAPSRTPVEYLVRGESA